MTGTHDELVTIGIPTYGRARSVERAIRSVLDQSHRAVEVIVADDASPDDTAEALRRLAREDARVKPLFHQRNVGHARNFRHVFEVASSPYFMWLSDDDWIDQAYVARCLGTLLAHPTLALVAGRARYYDADRFTLERPMNLDGALAATRVARYFGRVDMNGPLYGVARTVDLARCPFEEIVGGDWLVVGGMAAQGGVRTLEDVHVNRSAAGMSTKAGFADDEFGLGGLLARNHHVLVALTVARRITVGQGAFDAVGVLPVRIATALFCWLSIVARFTLVDLARRLLAKAGLLRLARRLIAPLRARRHR